jgi:hypothetical protein
MLGWYVKKPGIFGYYFFKPIVLRHTLCKIGLEIVSLKTHDCLKVHRLSHTTTQPKALPLPQLVEHKEDGACFFKIINLFFIIFISPSILMIIIINI